MAHPDQFYVTLPSNSSEQYYGRQDPASFHTKLSTPLYVDPTEYEVGLAEVVFPLTWENIPACELRVRFAEHGDWDDVTIPIKGGRYRSIPHLLQHVNKKLDRVIDIQEELKQDMRFTYDKVTGRCTCHVAPGLVMILPEVLSIPLGFGNSKRVEIGGFARRFISPDLTQLKGPTATSLYGGNISRLSEALMIYTDLIESQRVGDHEVSLLRHVAQPSRRFSDHSDIAEERFTNIHYVGLQRAHVDTIHIHIADATGNKPTFRTGITIVKLHFRRKR